jgi:hypothetical protein
MLYALLAAVGFIVSQFASPHVQKILTLGNHIPRWSGWAWAVLGLGLLLVLGLEGAFREIKQSEDVSALRLASQEQTYEDRLQAEQRAYADERASRERTQAALEKERAQPVAHAHRDRIIEVAGHLSSRIGAGLDCQYWSKNLRASDAKAMIASHFPEEATVFIDWDHLIAERQECRDSLIDKVHDDIRDRMNSDPWNDEAIAGAFNQYLDLWERIAGSGVPEPTLDLYLDNGKGLWGLSGFGSQILNFAVFNAEESASAIQYEADFRKWFNGIISGAQFANLRTAWHTVRAVKGDAWDAAHRIIRRDEIYGRCAICSHP